MSDPTLALAERLLGLLAAIRHPSRLLVRDLEFGPWHTLGVAVAAVMMGAAEHARGDTSMSLGWALVAVGFAVGVWALGEVELAKGDDRDGHY